MNNAEIVDLAHQNLINTYGCALLAFVRGTGAYLYDADGNRYLDFSGGLAVTSKTAIPRRARDQGAGREAYARFQRLSHRADGAAGGASGCGHFYMGGSHRGEANEVRQAGAALGPRPGGAGQAEVVSTLGPFHGRTLARRARPARKNITSASSRWNRLPHGSCDDVEALDKAVHDETIAIMLEPIQGEGGAVTPRINYLKRVRDLCDRRKILLILDEVQTDGGGRQCFSPGSTSGSLAHHDVCQSARRRLLIGAIRSPKANVAQSPTPGVTA